MADFIGRANFVSASVEAVADDAADVSLLGRRMRVPAAPGVVAGSPATVVVRPESMRVGGGDLRGVVRRAIFLGPMAEYELEVDSQTPRGPRLDGRRPPRAGRPEQAYALPEGDD